MNGQVDKSLFGLSAKALFEVGTQLKLPVRKSYSCRHMMILLSTCQALPSYRHAVECGRQFDKARKQQLQRKQKEARLKTQETRQNLHLPIVLAGEVVIRLNVLVSHLPMGFHRFRYRFATVFFVAQVTNPPLFSDEDEFLKIDGHRSFSIRATGPCWFDTIDDFKCWPTAAPGIHIERPKIVHPIGSELDTAANWARFSILPDTKMSFRFSDGRLWLDVGLVGGVDWKESMNITYFRNLKPLLFPFLLTPLAHIVLEYADGIKYFDPRPRVFSKFNPNP